MILHQLLTRWRDEQPSRECKWSADDQVWQGSQSQGNIEDLHHQPDNYLPRRFYHAWVWCSGCHRRSEHFL